MQNTFTILHTNDLHSAFIGLGPASDYTPFTLKKTVTAAVFASRSYSIDQPLAAVPRDKSWSLPDIEKVR